MDEAHEAIRLWEYYSHKVLDPEQRFAVELMMAKRKSGLWAAETTGRMVSRQNGKGDETEVVEFYGLVESAEAIIHSAHEIPTSRRAHARLDLLLQSHRDMRNKVKAVRYGDGKQEIEMKNEGIIAYKTRTKAGGRGLDDISRLVLDEAQEAQPEHMAAMSSVMAVNPNPQINMCGTAAVGPRSELWWDVRERALKPDPGRFSYLEHSAETVRLDEDGEVETVAPDPHNRESWKQANFAMRSGRISESFLEEELRRLKEDLFSQEHLGVWVPRARTISAKPKIDPHWWRAAFSTDPIVGPIVIGIDTTYDLDFSAVVIAGRTANGQRSINVVQHDPGSHWVELALIDLLEKQKIHAVTFEARGPAKALRRMVERLCSLAPRSPSLDPLVSGRYAGACASFVADTKACVLRHPNDPRLSNVAISTPAKLTNEVWVWDRRVGDITTLVAATCAAAVAESIEHTTRKSIYETEGVLTV